MTEPGMQANPEQAHPSTPQNMKIDDKAIKKLAGTAISQVNGVLGVEGNLTDMLKGSDDMTKGLQVSVEDNKAQVSAKIITEFGKNIPEIVSEATRKVTEELQSTAGLTVEKVDIEVVDTLTKEEYEKKNNNRMMS